MGPRACGNPTRSDLRVIFRLSHQWCLSGVHALGLRVSSYNNCANAGGVHIVTVPCRNM